MKNLPLKIDAVRAAAKRIAALVERTPVTELGASIAEGGPRLLLKLENRQVTGSFKPRGACNAALAAKERGPVTGLITFSSGNHGQALAYAAQHLGVPALVVAPEDVRSVKLEAMTARGATVVRRGLTSHERMVHAQQLAIETGYTLIPPYDDLDVMAGQGTIGLEIREQAGPFDLCCIPIGGGGLVSGISTALDAALKRSPIVVGVEPEDADDARRSVLAHEIRRNEKPSRSACDGLRNTQVGDIPFAVIQKRVSKIVTVTDSEVLAACALIESAGLGPVEPSGAAAAAAVLAGRAGRVGETVVAIVSGGNAS